MSVRESGTNLAQSTKILLNQWEDTKTHWRDDKSQQFEQNHLSDLPGKVHRATALIEELDIILKKIRHACE